jgi:hypothetical protein
VKLLAAIALTVYAQAQVPAGQPPPKTNVAVELHLKAVKLVEITGVRDRMVAALPGLIEQAKATMQKQCPDCDPAYSAEWGKRMTDRAKIDDFVNVAAAAYEKRFTDNELTELLTVVRPQKTEKPVPPIAGTPEETIGPPARHHG